MSQFKVELIGNPDTDTKGDVLGITPERWSFLAKKCEEATKSSEYSIEAISKASEHCVHANELSMVVSAINSCFAELDNPISMLFKVVVKSQKEG